MAKGNIFQRYLSLILSFIIVFNLTMIPVFAEGESIGDAPTQEEQAEDDAAEAEEPSEEPAEKPEDEPSEEPAEEPEEKPTEEPAEEPVENAEPEEHVGGEGKYVKEVYIAYAKTEEEAKVWLRKNKWEPLTGNADFNAGKASKFDDDVAAVMGIRRTDKKEEAITDMAVMNMKGGYSFPDYQTLLKEKKSEINEFINNFVPVLQEYRENYNGDGSEAGKARAELAHSLLNRFYDGNKNDPYAVNDTGKPLGDLLLKKTMQEDGGEGSADLQQIILESSGPALTIVEVCLALAADTGKETWLERLKGMDGDDLTKNLSKYVPEAEGQDVAPSAAKKLLKQNYGDQAKVLADQWDSVHDRIIWLENYNEKNGLWQDKGESSEAYADRVAKHFDKLDKAAEGGLSQEHRDYSNAYMLYTGLYETPYSGDWGETLGDFFNPAEGGTYAETSYFLPFAAALSKGQRASASLVSLETLLMLGMATEKGIQDLFPKFDDLFDGAENISIYSGINRGIYRGGVALTNNALMEKNQNGSDPFADMWSFNGIYNITVYSSAIVGVITLGIGAGFLKSVKSQFPQALLEANNEVAAKKSALKFAQTVKNTYKDTVVSDEFAATLQKNVTDAQKELTQAEKDLKWVKNRGSRLTTSARVIMGVGGALLVGAAIAKGYQLYRYYQKTFTQIPMYIVDEADIVSYDKDAEGNETKLITFDQFVYYSVVRCNRQIIGEISDWQDGVSDYPKWGCGNAADLNGDFGQEWLALYTVKSPRKGDPILADSLVLQYGSKDMPKGCSKALHMFTYENAADLGDTAYSFNNNKKGVYFFWDVDEGAFDDKGAASAFDGGSAAIAGGLGLIIGIIGTAVVMRRKKKEE